jgi:hypothetical protein
LLYTNSRAVHEDASNGPASKRKLDDVTEVPSADVEGKENAPEAKGEDLEVPAISTEAAEDVSEKTKAGVTDAEDNAKEEKGTEVVNGIKEAAEKAGAEIGKETAEVEANGGKEGETGALSEETPAVDVAAPAPKRHKGEAEV